MNFEVTTSKVVQKRWQDRHLFSVGWAELILMQIATMSFVELGSRNRVRQ
jgi:hypothetical protein